MTIFQSRKCVPRNTKPAVLHIGKYYFSFKGGIERVLLDICEQTSKTFRNFVIVADDLERTKVERLHHCCISRIKKTLTIYSQPVIFGVKALIKRISPDVIVYHLPNPLISFHAFFLSTPSKIVVFYHSDINKNGIGLLMPFIAVANVVQDQLLKRSTKIIVSSPKLIVSSKALAKYRSKCVVVPLGIDPKRLDVSDARKIQLFRDQYKQPLVLFVGRLVFYKGISFLIEAMAHVNATLLIVGTGPMRHKLESQVRSLQLQTKVIFLDHCFNEDLAVCFHASEVVVLPSITSTEAFGIVLLEAMACGKPLVTTELGTGTSFVNQDGKTGFVVAPEDAHALAERINLLIKDAELRKRMGINARQRSLEYFTIEKFAGEFSKVIQNALFA